MKQTQNYHLSQWDKTDRIKMEDFNADNSKIEAALSGLKALCNCRVYSATYVGTGEIPLVVECPNRPVAVFVKNTDIWGFGIRGNGNMWGYISNNFVTEPSVIWEDRSLTLGTNASSPTYSYNTKDKAYAILILMDAEN